MSQDSEKVKSLVEFKKRLETRVAEVDSELKELQAMLDIVNSILLEKGFQRVEMGKAPTSPRVSPSKEQKSQLEVGPTPLQAQAKPENVIVLKSDTGDLLADLYVDDASLRIVLAEDKNFSINTPPFTQFLLERVLLKMQERDTELARAGQLSPDRIFCYNIIRDGDIIREIEIRNFDEDRLREIKSSIRWTLEKMYEKMKGTN